MAVEGGQDVLNLLPFGVAVSKCLIRHRREPSCSEPHRPHAHTRDGSACALALFLAGRAHGRAFRSGTTSPATSGLWQKSAHACISLRRSSTRSLRAYARDDLLPMVCASAVSRTRSGKLVRSDTQSAKVERNPCAVM